MTPEEKTRISSHTFDELWNDLWVYKDLDVYKYHYQRSRKKFDTIKTIIPELIEKTKGSTCLALPWGFPKGKTDIGESAKECAVRELKEEVNIFRSRKNFPDVDYGIHVWDIGPVTEMFHGSDGRTYVTYYFIADCKTEFPLSRINPIDSIRGSSLSEEANDAKWVTFSEAQEFLIPTHISLLDSVRKMLRHD